MNIALLVLAFVFAISAGAFLYPYLIYPALLRLQPLKTHRVAEPAQNDGSDFALFFCAFNEQESLAEKLSNLRLLLNRYPALEINVYNDASSDRTAELIRASGLSINLVDSPERHGKAHGMKAMTALSSRRFFVFTDANVTLDIQAIDRLAAAYADESVGGVCGHLRYSGASGSVAKTGGLYWRLEERIKALESRSGSVLGADGSIFSIRGYLYPSFPDSVLDDLTVSLAPVFAGHRFIKDESVVAFEELVESRGQDYRRRVRIATRAYHTHLFLRPQVKELDVQNRWRYISHRYMRWIGVYPLAIAAISGALALALVSPAMAIGVSLLSALALWVGARMTSGPVASAAHLVISIALTGWGVRQAGRGNTVTTWATPRASQ